MVTLNYSVAADVMMDRALTYVNEHATKTNRDKVFELREMDPRLPAVRIAERLSITRERVRQILKEMGLPTHIPKYYGACERCGEDIPQNRRIYCSAHCRYEAIRTTFKCTFCGNSKTVRRSAYDAQLRRGYKYMYCSVQCRNRGNWAFRDE